MPVIPRSDGQQDEPYYILIVEDTRLQSEILKDILQKRGFTIAVAENGKKPWNSSPRKSRILSSAMSSCR